nr:MFS transporter [Corynebacterium sp. c6VSa_13]
MIPLKRPHPASRSIDTLARQNAHATAQALAPHPDQPPARPLRAAAIPREIWILVSAAFMVALGYGLIAPIIPQFARSFDVGMAAAGAVISIFAFSRLVFAPTAGWFINKMGSRTMYLSGLAVVAVTTGAVSIAHEYWHILLLRGLGGIGSTMFTVSAMGLIVKLAPPSIRGKCSSAYASAFLVGNIIGPVAGAGLAPLGMRLPFLIYGATLCVACAIVWMRMPATVGQDSPDHPHQEAMSVAEALRDRAYRVVMVSGFANGWSNFGVRVATLPLFAAAVFKDAASVAGLAMAAFAVGNAVCLQFSGTLADRLGRRPLLITGLLINALFTGMLGWADSMAAVLVVSALAGAGAGVLNPAQQAVVADVIGSHRSGGAVLAAYQMAGDCGTILGPIVVGMIVQAAGFQWGFGVCGLISLAAAVLWMLRGRETLGDHLSEPGAAAS